MAAPPIIDYKTATISDVNGVHSRNGFKKAGSVSNNTLRVHSDSRNHMVLTNSFTLPTLPKEKMKFTKESN